MSDPTESIRRAQQAAINSGPTPDGDGTFTTDQLAARFDVLGFMAPYVVVSEKSTGRKGSLMFKHSPRVYFGLRYDDE